MNELRRKQRTPCENEAALVDSRSSWWAVRTGVILAEASLSDADTSFDYDIVNFSDTSRMKTTQRVHKFDRRTRVVSDATS